MNTLQYHKVGADLMGLKRNSLFHKTAVVKNKQDYAKKLYRIYAKDLTRLKKKVAVIKWHKK